jgi:hypothetical protein
MAAIKFKCRSFKRKAAADRFAYIHDGKVKDSGLDFAPYLVSWSIMDNRLKSARQTKIDNMWKRLDKELISLKKARGY